MQTGHSTLSVSVSCAVVKTTELKAVQATASPPTGSPPDLEDARLEREVFRRVRGWHFQALLHCWVLGIYGEMPLPRENQSR